ncbi:MAG: hypothetical protein F6K19_09165 [Cyanothece sp. SIO1E1]|nr:hypothetical protein [Cyanothece sp. SIO1E1]
MSQSKDETRILYVSACALKIESLTRKPALDIAYRLKDYLARSIKANSSIENQPCLSIVWQNFTINVTPLGWIHLGLQDPGLALWLQYIVDTLPARHDQTAAEIRALSRFPTSPENLFSAQYAHARCCSLLRLGHQEKLITLADRPVDQETCQQQIITPAPIPWLNSEYQLRLVQSSEWKLMHQLLVLIDNHYDLKQSFNIRIAYKQLYSLSQSFQVFYCTCQIFGSVKNSTLKLAQARLGLILATQLTLKSLLLNYFGIPAPTEL